MSSLITNYYGSTVQSSPILTVEGVAVTTVESNSNSNLNIIDSSYLKKEINVEAVKSYLSQNNWPIGLQDHCIKGLGAYILILILIYISTKYLF